MEKPFFCHAKRREGSQALENSRFFASLRMTLSLRVGFGKTSQAEERTPLPHGFGNTRGLWHLWQKMS
jgi:hypothetical protein